jgi:hypothetical protein
MNHATASSGRSSRYALKVMRPSTSDRKTNRTVSGIFPETSFISRYMPSFCTSLPRRTSYARPSKTVLVSAQYRRSRADLPGQVTCPHAVRRAVTLQQAPEPHSRGQGCRPADPVDSDEVRSATHVTDEGPGGRSSRALSCFGLGFGLGFLAPRTTVNQGSERRSIPGAAKSPAAARANEQGASRHDPAAVPRGQAVAQITCLLFWNQTLHDLMNVMRCCRLRRSPSVPQRSSRVPR